MAFKKRNGHYWAVEFAGEQVRLCQFSLHGEQVAVEQCETRPAAGFDFKRFRQESGTNGSVEAVILCAVPRSEVFLKPFVVPRSEEMDLHEVTSLKLEQAIGNLDLATTFWGYLEGGAQDGKKRSQILAAAVSRAYVERILSQHFADSDQPAVMECAALAAVRAYLELRPQATHCELLVDCAADGISVFVVKDGEIESAHFVPSDCSPETAINEIQRLIVLHRGKREQAPIEAITCLGGEMSDHLATAFRQGSLGLPVVNRLGRAPQWITNAEALPADWDRDWHRVVGLIALTRTNAQAAINFLAAQAPRRRARAFLPTLAQLGTPVLALTLVALLGATFLGQRALAKRREVKMTAVVEKGRQISADLQHREQALAILKRYGTERFSLTRLLIELNDVAPPGIVLDTLTLNADGSLTITGRCKSYSEGQEFTRKLNASQSFIKAEAPSLRKEREGIIFKMTFSLSPKVKKVGK
jgi:Tfp pilus assembly protein PilN